jgi:N-acetylmuramoyl-L-alanine amidase
MRAITHIVVHTCGSASKGKALHQTVDQVRAYHMSKGWTTLGYHRYVEKDGAVREGRPDSTTGAHAAGFNATTLGICCSGHGDVEPFNTAQMLGLLHQIVIWCRKYNLTPDRVIGHSETDDHGGPPVYKTCPGLMVDMALIRALVANKLEAA